MITIIMAVQTSMACPSQWDAWDEAGNYYYLRFRHGYGAVRRYQTENWVDAPERADPDPADADHSRPGWALRLNSEYIGEVSHFLHGEDENLGDISLEGVLRAGRAGAGSRGDRHRVRRLPPRRPGPGGRHRPGGAGGKR